MQIKSVFIYLALFSLSACGGGGGGGGNGSSAGNGPSNFTVPSGIESAVFRECLESQASEKGWRSHADVRSIECERDYSVSDYGIGVETLAGVQAFPNLEEIIIHGSGTLGLGRISDLSPLRGLGRLRTIEMYESDLRSLESIRDMSSLRRLVIIPTRFSDLSPVATLGNLDHLDLSIIIGGIQFTDLFVNQ